MNSFDDVTQDMGDGLDQLAREAPLPSGTLRRWLRHFTPADNRASCPWRTALDEANDLVGVALGLPPVSLVDGPGGRLLTDVHATRPGEPGTWLQPPGSLLDGSACAPAGNSFWTCAGQAASSRQRSMSNSKMIPHNGHRFLFSGCDREPPSVMAVRPQNADSAHEGIGADGWRLGGPAVRAGQAAHVAVGRPTPSAKALGLGHGLSHRARPPRQRRCDEWQANDRLGMASSRPRQRISRAAM